MSTITSTRRASRCDELAKFFAERPYVYIDGLDLAHIGGVYAWRTRLSNLRRAPYHMQIDNLIRVDASKRKRSLYRYVPEGTQGGA